MADLDYQSLLAAGRFSRPQAETLKKLIDGVGELTHSESTGLIEGCYLTINADTTKVDITAGTILSVDYTDPKAPLANTLAVGPFLAVTLTHLASALITYLGIDRVTGLLVQQATPFTNAQRRSIVSIGRAIHSNMSTVNAVATAAETIRSGINQLQDLMQALGPLNTSGNVYSANGVNLKLNKTAGVLFQAGSNFYLDPDNPHNTAIGQQTALTFRERTQTGVETGNVTDIDPENYDVAGTVTAMPNNRFQIKRIYVFQTANTRIQYGQVTFKDIPEALAAIPSSTFVVEPNIAENGVLRAYLIVKKGCTDLTDATQAAFVAVGKYGSLMSSGTATSTAFTWNIVASANVATASDRNGYLMNTGGTLRTVTLPVAAPSGFRTAVNAKGAQVRIVANGNTIDRVTAGNDLLLADGDTAELLAYGTSTLRVI